MATRSPYRTVDEQPTTDGDPSTAFVDLVQRDPTVCENCFQKTHDATVIERYSGLWGWDPVEWWTPRPTRTHAAHAARMTYGLTTSCTCGQVDGGKRRPISFRTACEYAENIISVLDEKNVSMDVDVLRDEVRERKRDPSTQGREDSDVFAPAVELAIMRGRNDRLR